MTLNNIRTWRLEKLLFILLIYWVVCMNAESIYAAATQDATITAVLERNEEIFNNNDIVEYAVRKIGWAVIVFLVWFADACSTLYDTAFGFIDFTSWDRVNDFTEAFKPVFLSVMALSIFALGIMMIFSHEKRPKIVMNICIAGLCITCSTAAFQELNGLAFDLKYGIENVGAASEKESEVYTTIDDSLVDLVVLSDRFGSLENLNYEERDKAKKKYTNPGINEDNFKYIDYTEVLNPKSDQYTWDANERDILSKKLYVQGSYTHSVVDVNNGFGWNSSDDADMANEFYYRYKFDFFAAGLKLLAYILVYVAMAYKCTRIAYELVVARLFAVAYSAELSGGEKISKILVFIRDSYVLLLTTTLCIRIYGLLNSFISETVDSKLAQVVFILFAAFCVVDGPNLVEKLLGMDAGLSSSTARMMAAVGVARAGAEIATAPARAGANFAMRRHEQNKFLDRMNGEDSNDRLAELNNDHETGGNNNMGAEGEQQNQPSAGGEDGHGAAPQERNDANTADGGQNRASSIMDDNNRDGSANSRGFDVSFMDSPSDTGRTSYFNEQMGGGSNTTGAGGGSDAAE